MQGVQSALRCTTVVDAGMSLVFGLQNALCSTIVVDVGITLAFGLGGCYVLPLLLV